MTQATFMQKYPIFTMEIKKNECIYDSMDAIISYFRSLIDHDPVADFIGGFDHYVHTKKLEDGEIASDILDAKLIAFCFGQKLLDPHMMSIRPRSIGVCERENDFIISFLEAPMPPVNEKMQNWVRGLLRT